MGNAVSNYLTLLGIARFHLEWIPFSGNRESSGQLIVAAVSGGLAAAALCIRWIQVKESQYRHLKTKLRHLAVMISGCDSGLGYSLAVHCHDKLGLTVFAGCLSPKSEGAFRLSQRTSNRMHIITLDITKPDSVLAAKELVNEMVITRGLELTALVNNAGVMVFGEFDWLTETQMNYQVAVNLIGTMSLTRAFIPLLRPFEGRIITISSHCALQALPGLAVYAATKTGLRAWSDALRMELAKFGMPVVLLIPGSFSAQSNILAAQGHHAKEMEFQMSPEYKTLYSDYFNRYQKYLSGLFGPRSPTVLTDKKLYREFNHALLSTNPDAVYTISPWRYTIYHFLFRITPTKISDWLVHKFVHMPAWKPQNVEIEEWKPEEIFNE